LDEENPTHAGLAQENDFGSAQLRKLPWLVKAAALLCCNKKCNKYDLTATQCFSLAHHNEWSRWFAISSPHLFVVLISVLWVGWQRVHN
jgi:hypothetical protein